MFDIEQYSSDFERHLDRDELNVFFMLTPSAIAPALAQDAGFDRLLEKLATSKLRRAVLVSSTSVYGDAQGQRVDPATPTAPNNARSERVAEIERRWRAGDARFSVLRLAGIYGPNRVVGRQQLSAGTVLSGSGSNWLNLIHVADAADLLFACGYSPNAQAVELGSDGCPIMRRDYYAHLAKTLALKAPRFAEDGSGRSGSKRCDPSATMRRLDWSPRYADYQAGLRHSLET